MDDRLENIFLDESIQQSDLTDGINRFYHHYARIYQKYYHRNEDYLKTKKGKLNEIVQNCNIELVGLLRNLVNIFNKDLLPYNELVSAMDSMVHKLGLHDSDWYDNDDGLLKWIRLTSFLNKTNGYEVVDQRPIIVNTIYTGCNKISTESFQTVSLIITQLHYQHWLYNNNSNKEALTDLFMLLGSLFNVVSISPETIIMINNELHEG